MAARQNNQLEMKHKQASTTSIMTFAGGENYFLNYRQGQSLLSRQSENNVLKMQTNHSGNFKDLHNSCETYGGMNGNNEVDKGMDSSNQLDTEPGEVYDEATPCGCSHSKYAARTSIIPEDKLKSLHK